MVCVMGGGRGVLYVVCEWVGVEMYKCMMCAMGGGRGMCDGCG